MREGMARIWTVASKELVDFVRDWRTLVALVLVPLLIFPLFFIALPLFMQGEMSELECAWIERKLEMYGLKAPNGAANLTKIVAGKQLWNYDNLEPAEKKLVL